MFLQSTGGCVRNISTLVELDQLAHQAALHLRVELQGSDGGLQLLLLFVPRRLWVTHWALGAGRPFQAIPQFRMHAHALGDRHITMHFI